MSVITGRIHSFQSMGTLDGPGVRFVVFMQGCNLRCKCCHNPDTWEMNAGQEFKASDVLDKIVRFKEYFGDNGGVTVSGGEPLLQSKFVKELFDLCHANSINTCLDTSGDMLNDDVRALLLSTDRVLLDIKYTDNESYLKNVGCDYDRVLEFLNYLDEHNIKTTLRQVIIPTKNDNTENIMRLNELANAHNCVDKVELLPFKKICQTKYDEMKIEFPFAHIDYAKKEDVQAFLKLIDKA